MTTDIEDELRELFRDKAGEAPQAVPAPAAAPRPVLRRARVHQVGTAVGSAAIVFALLVGSVAGLNALLRDGAGRDVGGAQEVFERTATIEGFTITSPSDWHLVNEWPRSVHLAVGSASSSETCTVDPSGNETCVSEKQPGAASERQAFGLPVFRLTNWDPGLGLNPCGAELGGTAAVLYVAFDAETAAGLPPEIDDPSFDPWPGHVSEGTGLCGPGTYAWFTVNGEPFFAWVGLGPTASEDDRATVMAAFESLVVDDGWSLDESTETTPAYVIAGGEFGPGDPWRIDLRYLGDALELSLEDGRGGHTLVADESSTPLAWAGTEPIFGVVAEGAEGVEFHPGTEEEDYDLGGSPVSGTIVGVPPTVDVFDLDLFFIDPPAGYGELGGRVIVTGTPEPSPSPSASPVGGPRPNAVELSGADLRQSWTARFTGSFEDDNACVQVKVGLERFDPHCPQVRFSFASDRPFMSGWVTPRLHMLAGTVPLEVEAIEFVSDTDEDPFSEAICDMGPAGWTEPDRRVCVAVFGPDGSGTVRYLDGEGNALFEEAMAWHADAATPSNEYPWTNEDTFITATGSAQGAEWKLQVMNFLEGYRLTFDGTTVFEGRLAFREPEVLPLAREGSDEPPDTIVLVLTPTQTSAVDVSHNSGQIWTGRWIPASTANGGEARLWIIELPGSGSASLLIDGAGTAICWPVDCDP